MVRPQISPENGKQMLEIEDMRHPVISEKVGHDFIPNSIRMGTETDRESFVIVTGPNMGGKSTLLRQVCLIVVMSQIGCFVPASSCKLSVFDRIFTRIGPSYKPLVDGFPLCSNIKLSQVLLMIFSRVVRR